MSFGFDPEVPAGFQDADFDMRDLERAAAERDTIFSAAPMRRTAEEEVRRQGYHVIGSHAAGPVLGGMLTAEQDPEHVSLKGWNVEVYLRRS